MQENHIHHGDCLPFLEPLPPQSVDALITDPPYASGWLHIGARQASPLDKYLTGDNVKTTFADFAGDHRDQRSHFRWMVLWLSECCRILKSGAPVCFASQHA